jgi:hypothetical protein
LLPVSAAHANGVAWRTRYAAIVRIGLAILVTLVACKNHDVERLNDVKRVVCACKEASCADQALAQLETSAIPRSPKTQEVAKEIFDCRAKLEEAERPTTDPDAEGSNAPSPPAPGSNAPAAAGSAASPAAGAAAPATP